MLSEEIESGVPERAPPRENGAGGGQPLGLESGLLAAATSFS